MPKGPAWPSCFCRKLDRNIWAARPISGVPIPPTCGKPNSGIGCRSKVGGPKAALCCRKLPFIQRPLVEQPFQRLLAVLFRRGGLLDQFLGCALDFLPVGRVSRVAAVLVILLDRLLLLRPPTFEALPGEEHAGVRLQRGAVDI